MTLLNDAFVTPNTALHVDTVPIDTVSIREASSLLEVSPATVRNWQRHGYLSKATKRHLPRKEVLSLKQKLVSGELDRLQKRANKKQASASFVPDEMLVSKSFAQELEIILQHISEHNLEVGASLCVLALRLCVLSEETTLDNDSKPLDLKSYSFWKRNALKNELSLWLEDVKLSKLRVGVKQHYVALSALLSEVHQVDVLGVLYQSLLATGEKSKLGSYYTPQDIVLDILEARGNPKGTLLDPCCGTGQFLLTAASFGYTTPENLIGFDTDGLSVKIARLNMLFAFANKDFVPRIYNLDALSANAQHLPNTIDLIATNPPWGASKNLLEKNSDIFGAIQSGESFSYFLVKCISLLEEGKHLSFILPESFLGVRQHADIRKYVLENCSVRAIHHLGRRFKGVYTPVIRLDLEKKKSSPDPSNSSCTVFLDGQSYDVSQARFSQNQHQCFDSYLSPFDEAILQTFYSHSHIFLKDKADWALGIVTGDNKKYINDTCLDIPDISDNTEAIITGKEIQPFRLAQARKFIHFEADKLQQVAPEYKYRSSEKLIYKFISKRLVFAYDDGQHLTLNSANCLIPHLPDMPIKVMLALLNSKPYQFFFEKRFHTHKVVRGDLEAMPLLLLPATEQSKLVAFVDDVLKCDVDRVDVSSTLDKINAIVYEALQLNEEQVEHIERLC